MSADNGSIRPDNSQRVSASSAPTNVIPIAANSVANTERRTPSVRLDADEKEMLLLLSGGPLRFIAAYLMFGGKWREIETSLAQKGLTLRREDGRITLTEKGIQESRLYDHA